MFGINIVVLILWVLFLGVMFLETNLLGKNMSPELLKKQDLYKLISTILLGLNLILSIVQSLLNYHDNLMMSIVGLVALIILGLTLIPRKFKARDLYSLRGIMIFRNCLGVISLGFMLWYFVEYYLI